MSTPPGAVPDPGAPRPGVSRPEPPAGDVPGDVEGGPPLRVGLVVEQCWHRVPGGTAVAAAGLLAGLDRHPGVVPVAVAARHRRPPPEPWRPPVDIRTLPLPRHVLYELWHGPRTPPVSRWTGRLDVLHATGWAVPPAEAPLVVTVHDLAFVRHPELFTAVGRRFFRRSWRVVVAEADVVVCSSSHTAADVEAAGVERSRIRVVPLGVDARPASAPEVARVRARYGLPDRWILFVGTREPRKNLARLVEAVTRLPEPVPLVVVGPAGWGDGADAGDRPGVRILGPVPGPDLRALYAAATVTAYPSLWEGFGFPVLESMAQGTPVVTSAGTATEEVAGGAAVLVDPTDPDSIAAGLARVLGDPDLASRLSAAGRARAAELSWDAHADAVAAVYRELGRG